MTNNTCDPIYVDLASESDDPSATIIESLCLNCQGQGITRLLLTKIPHYKEVVLTSFECNECHHKNTGIQTSTFQEFGLKYELAVSKIDDLSRQVVKSDYATVKIPELDFEIPAGSEKGEISTVEGIISKALNSLSQDQETRKALDSDLAEKIQEFIGRLQELLNLSHPFTIIVDDPSGNSFIENLEAPNPDPKLTISKYKRSDLQNETLGLQDYTETQEAEAKTINEDFNDEMNLKSEVLQFSTLCDHCGRPSVTKMKVVNIPHFKEVVIMATECDSCGYKSNEVKSGGGIEPKGKKYVLTVKVKEDLSRDVLKSENCSIIIPELNLDVGAGILVGKFTTVEGLLSDVKEDLKRNPFLLGDSASEEKKQRLQNLLDDIQSIINGTMEARLILDDPTGNSYLQNIYTPDEDPRLVEEEYDRSFEQNEDLGLNDMKVENYADN